jgi:hypothetical protein
MVEPFIVIENVHPAVSSVVARVAHHRLGHERRVRLAYLSLVPDRVAAKGVEAAAQITDAAKVL